MYKASIFNYMFNSVNGIVMIINGVIMVPFYFNFMTVSTYGSWLATGNVVAMLGLVESGLSYVMTQKMSVAVAEGDENFFLELAGANMFTAVLMATMLFGLGLSISPFIADWINAEEAIKNSITIAYVVSLSSAAIAIINSLVGVFPQVWQETKTIGIINTVVNVLGVLSLVFYLHLGFGVISLALGYLTRAILIFLGQGSWVFVKWRKRNLKPPTYNFDTIKDLLINCYYPFLSRTSVVIMGNSQSFILALFINPTVAAIYDITGKIALTACSFVSMANSSFFALFSLTFASKSKTEINDLIQTVSLLFLAILSTALLYSMVFTQSVVSLWLGSDKYGGDFLLAFIILALLISQVKQFLNNLLYTGGLINKSAKLDLLSLFLFVVSLLSIVKFAGIYTIPIATITSGLLFIGMYARLLKNNLDVEVSMILKRGLSFLLITISFVLVHFLLKIKLSNMYSLLAYCALFTICYISVVVIVNRSIAGLVFRKWSNV